VEDVSMMTGEEVNAYDAFLVFLNGLIVGVHTKPTQLVEKGEFLRTIGY
jgi:DNA-directed RNA polymerase III subunit RPC2